MISLLNVPESTIVAAGYAWAALLAALGLAPNPTVVVTMELLPAHA